MFKFFRVELVHSSHLPALLIGDTYSVHKMLRTVNTFLAFSFFELLPFGNSACRLYLLGVNDGMNLADLIRETRERKGLSQRQLSLLSGITREGAIL